MMNNSLRRRIVGSAVALTMVIPLAALANPGDLDLTFGGGDGFVAEPFSGETATSALAVQADDATVVVGSVGPTSQSYEAFIARYTAAGELDAGYGAGGVSTLAPDPAVNSSFEAVVIQPDGKAVAVGTNDTSGAADLLVARFDVDGNLDPTFGIGGYVVTDLGGNDRPIDVDIQPDGKVVVAAFLNGGPYGPSLVRYDALGVLDPTFGSGGHAHWATSNVAIPYSLEVLASGKILVGGSIGLVADPFVARFTSAGTLDGGFGGGDGWVRLRTPDDDVATDLIVQPDGKIVVLGARHGASEAAFVGRLQQRGAIDTSFGGGDGYDEIAVETLAYPRGVIASDGSIVASGFARHSGGLTDTTVARWASSGVLDPAFGIGGVAQVDLGGGLYDTPFAIGVQSGDLIVVAGTTSLGNGNVQYIARFDAA